MVTVTKTFKIKRLEPNQLTKYFWKDGDLAYSDNQLHFNDAGKAVVLADKEYVQGTLDDKLEENTNEIMSGVPTIINAMIDSSINGTINDKINLAVNEAIANSRSDFLLSTYPLGAIYMSVSDTDPSYLFGGSWQYWGSGKVPVSYDPNNPDLQYVEQEGGTDKIILTEDNMPVLSVINTSGGNYSGYLRSDVMTLGTPGNAYGWTVHNGSQISPATRAIGVGEEINIRNPYITCYMWKRVG